MQKQQNLRTTSEPVVKHFLIAAISCALVVLAAQHTPASESVFPYPQKAQIQRVLDATPESTYIPARPLSDRPFWKRFAFDGLLELAAEVHEAPVVEITDALYLQYSETGERIPFTEARRARLRNLGTLMLAECVENKGRFLPKIEAYVRSYLAMKSWTDSAHDKKLKVFNGEVIGVDLFAANSAILLSTVYSVLGEELSPELKTEMERQLRHRIITPYLEACRKGDLKGSYSFWWLTRKDNWNPVCTAGIVYTTLIVEKSKTLRAEVIACALAGTEFYLDGFPADGYCSEGMHYWDYGYGNFLFLGEILGRYSNWNIDLFADPMASLVAEFPQKMQLADQVYPAYADSKISDSPSPYCLLALARNFAIPVDEKLPDTLIDKELLETHKGYLHLALLNALAERPVLTAGSRPRDHRSWYKTGQVLVCRPEEKAGSLHASIKAGHNGELHNHNDVGSYVVWLDGMFACIDPGPEEYTARTFSEDRYESNLINSWGHPVPLVAGTKQCTGREHKGVIQGRAFSDESDTLQIDLSAAYDVPTLRTLQRSFKFNRKDNTVKVVDSVQFTRPDSFGTAIITYSGFKLVSPNEILFMHDNTVVRVLLSAAGGTLKVTPDTIDEDAVAGVKPIRIGIDFLAPVTTATIEVKYEQN